MVAGAASSLPAQDQQVAELRADSVRKIADAAFGGAEAVGGAAVVVVVSHGKILLERGYGLANPKTRRPVDPDATLFRIGSVTKLFTAISTLQSMDRGVIDSLADINTYLRNVNVQVHDRFAEPVTMADLLRLHAGRFDWTYSFFYPSYDDDAQMDAAETGRRFWRTQRPGGVSAYDNNGVGLMGFAAAAANRMSYPDLVRTAILEPLGMTHSVAGLPRDRVPEMVGCADENKETAYQSCPYELIVAPLRPSGDMTVTAGDMSRLLLALLAGGRLDGHEILSPRAFTAFTDFTLNKLDPRLPAFGRVIYESYLGGRRAIGHDGGVGRFGASVRLYPELDAGVFVAVQSGLDWEHPAHLPNDLSGLLRQPKELPPSKAMLAWGAARGAFERAFVERFVPPAAAPPLGGIQTIPLERLKGRYWTPLFKGKRALLDQMVDRLAPAVIVSVAGPDRLRMGATTDTAMTEYRAAGLNAFLNEQTHVTMIFGTVGEGIYANSTGGSAPFFLEKVPWHYDPAATIYPLPIALAFLLTATAYGYTRRKVPVAKWIGIAAAVGVLLITAGVLAELEFAITQVYHLGRWPVALAWRIPLHLGVLALAAVPIVVVRGRRSVMVDSNLRVRWLEGLYVSLLAVAAVAVIGLAAYWGLIGRLDT